MKLEFGAVDHVDRQDNTPIQSIYDSRLKLVELYERYGFSTFHVTEHHFTPLGLAPSPLIFLAAASRITKRIHFAPLVLIATLYNPLRLAAEICMMDHLTKGRIEIGLGRGVSPHELGFYGIDPKDTRAIYKEAVEVLMAALTQNAVDYHGEYFDFSNVPMELRPLQQPHPPIWYGTASADTAARAACENANIVSLQRAADARVPIERYKEEWRKIHGAGGKKMPHAGLTRHVYVAETDAKAEERGRFGFDKFFDSLGYLWRKFGTEHVGMQNVNRSREEALLTGSPATVREKIEKQIELSGANYFVARFAYGNLTHEESVRSLELFANEVMPHFQ
jgi:alkanesulfonate monooxygenase SsuD/methylene tetrahydromethanopterin reductase-like flavin-dependent oxidoreductase (luciferase family)